MLNMVVLTLLLFCLVIPSCWSACKRGCGKQDVGETPVDDLPCLEAMESISNFVLQKPNVTQCKKLAINNKKSVPRRCSARRPVTSDNQLILSATIAEGTAFRLASPLFYSDNCYDGRLFCAYNVQCPEAGHFIHYKLTSHNIEDPTVRGCLDQLGIQKQSSNGFLTSCGQVNSVSLNFDDLSTNSGLRPGDPSIHFLTTFFSGRRCESDGFYLWVNCIKFNVQNVSGCFDSSENRRRREINDHFTDNFPMLDHSRMSRIYNIARFVSFTYTNNRIKISGTNFFFDKVFLLIVFHFEEGLFSYCGNSQRTFTGLGRMRVRNGLALYIDDGDIEPQFRPTPSQDRLIGELLTHLMLNRYNGTEYNISDRGTQDHPSRFHEQAIGQQRSLAELCNEAIIAASSCNAVTRFAGKLFIRENNCVDA